MNRILLGLVVVFGSIAGYAQQDPQFSQNMNNKLYPNPGVAGSNGGICATVLGRQQWVQFDGRPETYLLSVHGAVGKLPLGVGLTVSQDKLGHQSSFGAKLAVAYRKDIGPGTLGAGISAGMLSFQMTGFTDVNANGYSDAVDGVAADPSIPDGNVQDLGMDFDLGVYYKVPGKMYLGLSSTHLNQSDLQGTDLLYKVKRHYYIMAGYEKELNPTLKLLPSVFVKTDAASAQIDINLLVEYNNLVWGGVSYRYQDAISPMVGIKKDNVGNGTLKVGYSYDVTTSQLKNYSSGSHEIFIGYCMNLPDNTIIQKHKNPRFL